MKRIAIIAVVVVFLASPTRAAEIFILPFTDPPGPSTWYVVQFYGNTQGAYRNRVNWYQAGQGLHFGVVFAARCGTPVVAVGEGEIVGIDDLKRGAGPHNLLIEHPNGYVSLYGHLLEAPQLYIGQTVEQGQVVGLSGDPDGSCTSRPHLHLEIRSVGYGYAYNPLDFIEADWDSLALFGPSSGFQRDLNAPHRWQTLADQPSVDFWGPMLNEYDRPWPPSGW
ncbi:MAG: M23 family metallopeptidase [Anaerolineae bacterium]